MKNAIIIGAGFGGLALGIRLQSKGFNVIILEKNEMPGGQAFQMKENGFTFDMGPTLISAPNIINQVFQTVGKDLSEYVQLTKLDPYYRIYFHDKSYIDYSGDTLSMKKQIAKFNKQDAARLDKFMEFSSKIYDEMIHKGLGTKTFINYFDLINFIPKAIKLKGFPPVYNTVRKYFKDFRNQFIFSFHPLFIGANPFRAPSFYLMIPYLEKMDGVWYSKGGMFSLVEAMTKLFTEIGGIIHTNTEVQKIVIENNIAKGVLVNDKLYKADLVVSNAHFYHTMKDLVEKKYRKKWSDKKLESIDYSMSCFLIFLGVRNKYPQLKHHTIILSKRYKELIKDIFDKKILPDDFSLYLHTPTKTDENMAPMGCENIYVLIPTANLKSGIKWNKISSEFTNKVIDYLEYDFGLTDLHKNIVLKEVFSPEDFSIRRNNYLGSAWGIESKITQMANFRPHNRNEDIKNLYIVGANTHPGASLPGVLLTAEATEKVIRNDFKVY